MVMNDLMTTAHLNLNHWLHPQFQVYVQFALRSLRLSLRNTAKFAKPDAKLRKGKQFNTPLISMRRPADVNVWAGCRARYRLAERKKRNAIASQKPQQSLPLTPVRMEGNVH